MEDTPDIWEKAAVPPSEEAPVASASGEAPAGPAPAGVAGASASPVRPPLHAWLAEGLRAGVVARPRLAPVDPLPWQFLLLAVLACAASIGLARLEIPGPAGFNYRGWLASWWSWPPLILAAWIAAAWRRDPSRPNEPRPFAGWVVLMLVAALPVEAASFGIAALSARESLPEFLSQPFWAWTLYAALYGWAVLMQLRVSHWLLASWPRALAVALTGLGLMVLGTWQLDYRLWYATAPKEDDSPVLELSQEVFEQQQALLASALAGIAPDRPGTADVYGIVFAPYAPEDVFLRESTLVADVLATRFDASGRIVHLLNNAKTTDKNPWATPLNLQRAIEGIARKMDREKDVLVLYLTSHGASDFRLAASHWPLEVGQVTPESLRKMLDGAGIRNRVIGISACFSGGWVEPLATDHSLVMTAADATHTSYGCGRLSELTFFGRAMFDEQLRRTTSFEEAFAAAVPVIKKREEEAGKKDGFSNPQIRVGAGIRPTLAALQKRLGANP